jgi:phage terminase large subunit-like protein
MARDFGGLITAENKIRLLEIEEKEIELELAMREIDETDSEIEQVVTETAKRQAIVNAYKLKSFVKDTFPIIEQGREFKDNWHIDIICELLQAVILGEVKNFLINQPRRTMKSLLTCVMFPAWVWTFLPHLRFLYTSYSAGFAGRDNEKTLDLINSNYYQQNWGGQFHLVTEQAKKMLKNSRGGFRQVFKIGKGTGEGGDFVIADDPNSIDEVESDLILKRTNNGWNEISYHNVADRNTAVRGIVQQRTGVNDLTGNILEDAELKSLYQVLCLPMKYESDHPNKNGQDNPLYLGIVSDYDKSDNPNLIVGEEKLWIDPRSITAPLFQNTWYQEWYRINFKEKGLKSKGDDQLLWENYITEEVVKTEIAHLKVHGESSQFQQRPTPRGGTFFNSANFHPTIALSQVPFEDGLSLCRYWDKAGSVGSGDWTVGLLLARTLKRPFQFYIIDVIRKQIGYYERMELIVETAKNDTFDYVEKFINNEYCVVIEREPASAGKDLATIEKDALVGYECYIDNVKKKKGLRAKPVRNFSESGRIKMVNAGWNTHFLKRLEKFDPNKVNQVDDEIDGLSGAFRKLAFQPSGQGSSTGGTY